MWTLLLINLPCPNLTSPNLNYVGNVYSHFVNIFTVGNLEVDIGLYICM
jgi:hypothetical protein